jgi:hypothetical protein
MLSESGALQKSKAVNPAGLIGALWSADEMIVESRVAMKNCLHIYREIRRSFSFQYCDQ